MTHLFTRCFVIITCLLVVLGCQRKEEEPVLEIDMLAGGSSKSWQIAAWQMRSGILNYNYFNSEHYQDCKKDDIVTFYVDNRIIWEEGETKCSPHDPDIIEEGVWAIDTETRMIMAGTETYRLIEISELRLVVETDGELQGMNVTNTITFKPI